MAEHEILSIRLDILKLLLHLLDRLLDRLLDVLDRVQQSIQRLLGIGDGPKVLIRRIRQLRGGLLKAADDPLHLLRRQLFLQPVGCLREHLRESQETLRHVLGDQHELPLVAEAAARDRGQQLVHRHRGLKRVQQPLSGVSLDRPLVQRRIDVEQAQHRLRQAMLPAEREADLAVAAHGEVGSNGGPACAERLHDAERQRQMVQLGHRQVHERGHLERIGAVDGRHVPREPQPRLRAVRLGPAKAHGLIAAIPAQRLDERGEELRGLLLKRHRLELKRNLRGQLVRPLRVGGVVEGAVGDPHA